MSDVTEDIISAIRRWRISGDLHKAYPGAPSSWHDEAGLQQFAAECALRARRLAAGGPVQDVDTGHAAVMCVVTKMPHIRSSRASELLIGRLLAFGLSVRRTRRLEPADDIARTLYPVASRFFYEPPAAEAIWRKLDSRFEGESFREIFGVPYSRELVRTGSEVMREFGLSAAELTATWEEGRRSIGRDEVINRYGRRAAEVILDGQDKYEWFRGKWPIGIQRIAAGVVAFALRHERLGDGQPIIILNGQYPGLAELFDDETLVIQATTHPGGPEIETVREWLIGADSRPAECRAGTVRRDASDGLLRLDSDDRVDSRKNVLHCSDGWLAGLIENIALFSGDRDGGALASGLASAGLTAEEIREIVAADPVITMAGDRARLTELTKGLAFDDCLRTILRMVPPVFGEANGYGSGLGFRSFVTGIGPSAEVASSRGPARGTAGRSPARLVLAADLPDTDDALGRKAISEGMVGFVVPAGGTGGRFGGYDVPETDPRRQKSLLPCFESRGLARSSLDLRLANAAYWRTETGGPLPVAIMGAPTNIRLMDQWRAAYQAAGFDDLWTYQQFGVYRLQADADEPTGATGGTRWVDAIAREADGAPSLKPPGNLGTLTCLLLSGIFDTWSKQGVEFLALANGDDAGFRLDPRLVGLLRRDDQIDAVINVVPWGVRGTIRTGQGESEVRADASGWCVLDSAGTASVRFAPATGPEVVIGGTTFALLEPRFDEGGQIYEVATPGGHRLEVDESARPRSGARTAMLNTNQIYLRMSAVRRLLRVDKHESLPDAVIDLVGRLPARMERKVLAMSESEGKVEVSQLSQAISGLFGLMNIAPAALRRFPAPGQYGGYLPLKVGSDVGFGQRFLDELAGIGDQLAFPA